MSATTSEKKLQEETITPSGRKRGGSNDKSKATGRKKGSTSGGPKVSDNTSKASSGKPAKKSAGARK